MVYVFVNVRRVWNHTHVSYCLLDVLGSSLCGGSDSLTGSVAGCCSRRYIPVVVDRICSCFFPGGFLVVVCSPVRVCAWFP
jgi:hypothetical protein